MIPEAEALVNCRFHKKHSTIVVHLLEERGDADYEDFRVFDRQEVENLRKDVVDFLKAVEDYLLKGKWIDK